MKDTIYMNDFYNEPETFIVGDITDLEQIIEKEFKPNTPTKSEELLNQEIETDYHNMYYNPKTKKYGYRTLKMKNKDYLKLNGK